jgi:flavorubredoxin
MRVLKQNIIEVGVIDWDRRMFDELIPLPDGTSYNAYLIKGSEKTALLDTVDPAKTSVLIENLVKAGVEKIDYIISHHAEQDHSGSIPDILLVYPDAKVVTNPKCKTMLMEHLLMEDGKFITVDDMQTLSLGDKTLQFVYTPWVHWPETMGTYLKEDKIYFSCDFFGSHLAINDLMPDDVTVFYEPAKRYYAEIMMPFRTTIVKNIEKLKQFQIEIIAPSHGPVYKNPAFIVDAYKDWSGDKVKNEVVIPYVSMHGSTAKMVEYFVECLTERGITAKQFCIPVTDLGKLAMALVDAATIVIGSSTVLTQAHPYGAFAAMITNALRPKTKFVSIIGSFGWGSRMVEHLSGLIPNLKVEVIEPVIAKGHPKDGDFEAIEKLADKILEKHRAIGIAK